VTRPNLGIFYDRYWTSPRRIREDVTRHWWAPARRKARGLLQGRRTLVIGCGPGDDLDELAALGRNDLVGLDLSEAALQSARKRGHRVVLADANALPFRQEIFKGVWISNVLMFTDRRLCLSECRRVARRNGRVVLTEPRAAPFLIGFARRFQALSKLTTSYWRATDRVELGGIFAASREEVFFLLSPLWAGLWYGAGLGPFSAAVLGLLVAIDERLLAAIPWLKRRAYLSLVVFEVQAEEDAPTR
jgi:SAM-dependent methyltransferase